MLFAHLSPEEANACDWTFLPLKSRGGGGNCNVVCSQVQVMLSKAWFNLGSLFLSKYLWICRASKMMWMRPPRSSKKREGS